MKKYEIVKSKNEFNNIIKKGNFIKNTHFVIYIMKTNSDLKRFGIAVSKKIGNAVVRNHLKRQIRNIIDNNKILFPKGYDYIIMLKRACLNEKYSTLNETLVELIKKR